MKFSNVIVSTLLSSLVASSPVPKVKVVYVTQFTTIKVTSGTAPPTLITPAPTAPAETEVDASQVSGFVNLAVDPEHDDNKDTEVTATAEATATEKAPETTKAPEPTTSKAPEPTTTSSKAPEPTTTSSQAPEPSSDSGNGDTYSGDGTYYEPYVGSCGWTNTIDDPIVAISAERYKEIMAKHNVANPNNNPVCGAKIKAWNPANGKSVVVKVVDSCPGCARDDLDLSHFAFDSIADHALGRFKLQWQWEGEAY